MASVLQKNLVEKNEQYASNFKEGHLALPPAKKYAVGRCSPDALSIMGRTSNLSDE